METFSQGTKKERGSVCLGRHAAQCSVCKHPDCEEIEQEWINWGHPTKISNRYGITTDALYRHCHAWGLFGARQRNINRAYERIIERSDEAPVTISGVVSAIDGYERTNRVRRSTQPALHRLAMKLFEEMTRDERENFAEYCELPDWFISEQDATPEEAEKGEMES